MATFHHHANDVYCSLIMISYNDDVVSHNNKNFLIIVNSYFMIMNHYVIIMSHTFKKMFSISLNSKSSL